MKANDQIDNYFLRHIEALKKVSVDEVSQVTKSIMNCYNNDGTIYIFGNGGSASTASHVCGDFIKGASFGLKKRFRIICFSDNIASMMAISNDVSYEDVFVEPLKNFVKDNDLVIGISGSGNSVNVVKALEYANSINVKTIAISGYSGGAIKKMATESVHVPIDDMEIVEDLHLTIFHAIKQSLIKDLMGENVSMGEVYDARLH